MADLNATEGEAKLEQRLYEAMFLIDSARGGNRFPEIIQHVTGLLQRQEAQIERIEKWLDNKLAYRIRQVERGIYVLVYFRLMPDGIDELRRSIELSEDILRALIVRADEIPEATGDLFTPEGEPIQPEPQPVEEPEAPAEEPEAPAEEPAAPAEEPATPAEEPATPVEEPAAPAEEPASAAEEPEQSAQPAVAAEGDAADPES